MENQSTAHAEENSMEFSAQGKLRGHFSQKNGVRESGGVAQTVPEVELGTKYRSENYL